MRVFYIKLCIFLFKEFVFIIFDCSVLHRLSLDAANGVSV